ncbi:hypothetical protein CEXT_792851 [Caerostris extrusa]|uniref:Uncharacterized protein n=1 Tax=Caerostris extrusa TaxID=172846 RepID=A0AAV4ML21_CAEEX|nr:hypothetical protein CEXT_792851 [Caerostris extrusa]
MQPFLCLYGDSGDSMTTPSCTEQRKRFNLIQRRNAFPTGETRSPLGIHDFEVAGEEEPPLPLAPASIAEHPETPTSVNCVRATAKRDHLIRRFAPARCSCSLDMKMFPA